jgi:hypothetical protein
MGLDTYAVYGKDHNKYKPEPGASNMIPNELFPNNHLCGGMFSGGGNSFRGKVYDEFVTWATGETLYEEEIPPDVVKVMYLDLTRISPNDFLEFCEETGNTYDITYDQAMELRDWFGVVVSETGSIVGWW